MNPAFFDSPYFQILLLALGTAAFVAIMNKLEGKPHLFFNGAREDLKKLRDAFKSEKPQ